MAVTGTSLFGPFRSVPSSIQLPEDRSYIGDLPISILERIIVDNLLVHGELDAVCHFVMAALRLASKALTCLDFHVRRDRFLESPGFLPEF
jgi:hypothetical protein